MTVVCCVEEPMSHVSLIWCTQIGSVRHKCVGVVPSAYRINVSHLLFNKIFLIVWLFGQFCFYWILVRQDHHDSLPPQCLWLAFSFSFGFAILFWSQFLSRLDKNWTKQSTPMDPFWVPASFYFTQTSDYWLRILVQTFKPRRQGFPDQALAGVRLNWSAYCFTHSVRI